MAVGTLPEPFPSPSDDASINVDRLYRQAVGQHPGGVDRDTAFEIATAALVRGDVGSPEYDGHLVATLADDVRMLLTPAEALKVGLRWRVDSTSLLSAAQVLEALRDGAGDR